ncbi:hypothetical protein MLD38_036671 [Melastoma candidum]|uniref:Uncharacterized protein n=1 Tax=Melastoma candidum TaxID=119954 RepID=A0ACB9LKD5_9MYRT|nr:hypothetical protein MLD38_036671 [Melastoma candidum]
MAIRSGEPFRLQIYEFLHALAQGGMQSQFSEMHLSNGEDQGASGPGLGVLISPMLKVLDEMYMAQDELINAKLIDKYRTKHNISASTGLSDVAVATGISDLIYESKEAPAAEADTLDDDLVNAWTANLGDDGLWRKNAPAMNRVNEYLAGAGADAPDVEEEHIVSRPSGSYDDMWAKTLLETAEVEEDDGRSSGNSSPESTGSVETSISSQFGGMNYPSLFSSKPSYGTSLDRYGASRFSTPSTTGPSIYEGSSSPIREEPPSYESSVMRRFESFENPLAGQSIDYQEENRSSSGNLQFASALYDFTAGGDDELNLTAGEEVEIEYEVDEWFYVKKKRPGRDGKMAGLVPVLYVSQS